MSMASFDVSSIPIDIHANKLLDWLLSRHHCKYDWPEKIAIVRQKINTALQDMPQNDTLGKILSEASPLNYYHCVKIVELLKETEVESKNIFGMYGSRRIKDWQDVLKLYQKDNLYLAEGASILGRNVIYEIPAIKRVISKCELGQAECMKKELGCKKQARELRDKFTNSCSQLGLYFEDAGNKTPSIATIGNMLGSQMSQELPNIFEKISSRAKDIREAVEFYRKFLKSTVGLTDLEERLCLGLLYAVIEKGNMTTYEWKHGEPPLKIEVQGLEHLFEHDGLTEKGSEDIDFGDFVVSGGADIELETGNIDWGNIGVDESVDEEIDFSIVDVELEMSGIVLEGDGLEGGLAKGDDALSVLENPDTRSEFMDALFELEGFIGQRIEETKSEKSREMSLSYSDDFVRADNLDNLYKQINQLLALFNETKTKQYLLVRESKRYITRLTESLLQNLTLAKKMDALAESNAEKFVQLGVEMKHVSPKIQTLTRQTRELQTEICKEISLKYNNRVVYITGGV